MYKKLTKLAAAVAGAGSILYSLATPAFALSLCGGLTNIGVSGGETLCTVTVGGLVQSALNAVLFVAFIAALIFLIIGGIKWIMSGGDKEGTTKAKETVTSALIGLAVVLGSWILINVVLNFFGVQGGLTNLQPPTIQPSAK